MRMDESNSPISFDKDYFLNQKRTADSAVYDQINAGDKSGGIGCQKCCSHAEEGVNSFVSMKAESF